MRWRGAGRASEAPGIEPCDNIADAGALFDAASAVQHGAMTPSVAPADPPRLTATFDGGDVTYTDEGDGPAILLLHGLPGSVRDFRHLSPRLEGLRRIRMDMPGFGGTSRRGLRSWPLRQRGELCAAFMDAIGLDAAVVVGHSMGGAVAAALGAVAPDKVNGLALLAAPGLRPHRGYTRSRVRLSARLLSLPGAQWLLGGTLRRGCVAAGFPRSTPQSELINALMDAAALDFAPHPPHRRALRAPTMGAYATDDRLVEPEIGEGIAATVPAGPRLRWESGGHNIQKTRADELAEALRRFVADPCIPAK